MHHLLSKKWQVHQKWECFHRRIVFIMQTWIRLPFSMKIDSDTKYSRENFPIELQDFNIPRTTGLPKATSLFPPRTILIFFFPFILRISCATVRYRYFFPYLDSDSVSPPHAGLRILSFGSPSSERILTSNLLVKSSFQRQELWLIVQPHSESSSFSPPIPP